MLPVDVVANFPDIKSGLYLDLVELFGWLNNFDEFIGTFINN